MSLGFFLIEFEMSLLFGDENRKHPIKDRYGR